MHLSLVQPDSHHKLCLLYGTQICTCRSERCMSLWAVGDINSLVTEGRYLQKKLSPGCGWSQEIWFFFAYSMCIFEQSSYSMYHLLLLCIFPYCVVLTIFCIVLFKKIDCCHPQSCTNWMKPLEHETLCSIGKWPVMTWWILTSHNVLHISRGCCAIENMTAELQMGYTMG